jgi:hypothetical protein
VFECDERNFLGKHDLQGANGLNRPERRKESCRKYRCWRVWPAKVLFDRAATSLNTSATKNDTLSRGNPGVDQRLAVSVDAISKMDVIVGRN